MSEMSLRSHSNNWFIEVNEFFAINRGDEHPKEQICVRSTQAIPILKWEKWKLAKIVFHFALRRTIRALQSKRLSGCVVHVTTASTHKHSPELCTFAAPGFVDVYCIYENVLQLFLLVALYAFMRLCISYQPNHIRFNWKRWIFNYSNITQFIRSVCVCVSASVEFYVAVICKNRILYTYSTYALRVWCPCAAYATDITNNSNSNSKRCLHWYPPFIQLRLCKHSRIDAPF